MAQAARAEEESTAEPRAAREEWSWLLQPAAPQPGNHHIRRGAAAESSKRGKATQSLSERKSEVPAAQEAERGPARAGERRSERATARQRQLLVREKV